MSNKLVAKLIHLGRRGKTNILFLLDAVLVCLAFVVAMLLRLEVTEFAEKLASWTVLLVNLPLTLLIFYWLGIYKIVLRYQSSHSVRLFMAGCAISGIVMSAASLTFLLPVPRSVPAIYAGLLFLMTTGVRFAWRGVAHQATAARGKPVVIYGAGEAGRQLAGAIRLGSDYRPVSFVDDDKTVQGRWISGLMVIDPSELPSVIREDGVRIILLAIPSAPRETKRQVVEQLNRLNVKIMSLPGMADIISGRAHFNELRTVQPEELLGRDPVPPIDKLLGANITGRVVMVTGAGGSIGSELCRQILLVRPTTLIMLDVSEFAVYRIHEELSGRAKELGVTLTPLLGSVQDEDRLTSILTILKVKTVYHAAAYKHVPMVEHNVAEGVKNNVLGTLAAARAAVEAGVSSFILISTDKAVRPTNIMGASKRMAELVCQSFAAAKTDTVFSMVRFGNVLGSSGSVIPKFQAQIRAGGPVTVTHPEVTRYFMTIPEAAQLVIQAGAMAAGGEVFVLDMGEPVKIVDLAESLIRLHGLQPFVLDSNDGVSNGDVAISFVGMRPGEKLYEEVLIGNDPRPTQHSRIMTAREACLDAASLEPFLSRLEAACSCYDAAQIREILMEAPIEFQPVDALSDMMSDLHP
ncbi:polysaccharide biosynthesis protein [Shinella oryzae]|uniref:Nucleoside-diphosphate sugar epimerase/dehydratase n=1 Tax=Shinella oryzae TaxID=2871820 RepID=A0ABY9JYT7_9HYPH|nr:nucleoside-diphosphate sugar epimerase/dehydratase [Shinella oryzae]WLS01483.1 nucleoside-diphosphate sugar epimerase/dehydratase [Shinella oryzae]